MKASQPSIVSHLIHHSRSVFPRRVSQKGRKAAFRAFLLAATAVFLTGPAQAGLVVLENHSFEDSPTFDPSRTDGAELFNTLVPSGWSMSFVNDPGNTSMGMVDWSNGQFNGPATTPNHPLPGTADGYQGLWFSLHDDLANRFAVLTYSSVANPLPTFVAGTTYTLTAAVGVRTDQFAGDINTTAFGQYSTYYATLLADGAPVGAQATLQISEDGSAPGGYLKGDFYDLVYTYTATAADDGKTMDIFLQGSGNWTHAAFDNIRLDATAVPEPSTAGMLFLSAAGLLAGRRRSGGIS